MKEIRRDLYLQRLIDRKENGLIKIITGIRRCGKSYLLDPIFKNHLIASGVAENHIIKIELDRIENKKYHAHPDEFDKYLRSFIKDKNMYYILLDEIQLVKDFELILTGLLYERNVDIYVTGSNSRFLSSDIITEFRGRGDQVHINPLSFAEFCSMSEKDKYDSWKEYMMYGGMPFVLSRHTDEAKSQYLKELFSETYYRDIIERNNIKRTDLLDSILDVLASSIGSLTNPQRIYDTFKSKGEKELSINTINSYISFLEDSFIISKAQRYDVKGRKYISTPQKYYFADIGLRNARMNFRQQEENHIMENIIYNELINRGFNVDVGVVEIINNGRRTQTEVDFVCNLGNRRYYIQSALNLETHEKAIQESRPLNNIKDSFRKIIVVKDMAKAWITEDGILVIGIIDFLLNQDSLDL